tara:strand:+ start:599 stop:985 length:387 start_codon:yes stop_codon:yes gene_type:complete
MKKKDKTIKKRNYKNPYIHKSKIHKKGLFSHKKFKKNEIIFKDVFPHLKNKQSFSNMFLLFDKFILHKCKYINHCKKSKNSTIIKKDNKYILITIKTIHKNKEILLDYDELHSKFSFIKGSNSEFIEC